MTNVTRIAEPDPDGKPLDGLARGIERAARRLKDGENLAIYLSPVEALQLVGLIDRANEKGKTK